MKKKIIIAINVLILAVIIGGFILWKMNKMEPATSVTNPNSNFLTIGNNVTQIPPPTTMGSTTPIGMLKITTKDGGSIIMKDFYQSPYTKILDPQNDASIKESIDYNIEFQPAIPRFFIGLQGNDLYTARENAEQGFLDKLGITKEDACRIKVTLGVHYSVNERASGVNYGLSFCPDGKPLPKNL
jgi:hypothetical protein